MNRASMLVLRGAAIWLASAHFALAADPPESRVQFTKEIAPIFVQKCLTCHGPDKAKGGYRLDTFKSLLEPGDTESPPVVAGDPQKSELFRRLVAENADDRMPQKDDPLPEPQIGLIRRWITEGAVFDGPDQSASLASLLPRAPYPQPPERYVRPLPVTALAFSPKGEALAASGYHEITIWEPATGKLLQRIPQIPQRVHALAYSPDASLLAVAGGQPGRNGEVALIQLQGGEAPKVLGTMPDVMLAVCFSPDGSKLAAAGADHSIHIYDVASGKETLTIQQHADWVTAIEFDAQGTQLASASRDRTARVYRAETGELETTFNDHGAPLFGVGFTADGKRVWSGGRDKRLLQWTVAEGKRARDISGFGGEVTRLHVRHGNIFSASTDRAVRQHAAEDGKLIFTFSGHQDWVYALAFDPENNRLASGAYDGEVRVWNVGDQKLIKNFLAAPGYEAAAPDRLEPTSSAR